MLFRYGDDITPFGATNTDNNYYRAMVDPDGTYRISGDVSGVKELLFSVQDGEFVFGKVAVLAEVGLGDLEIGDDGGLDLVLGGPERAANWLPLPAEAVYINVREFVADWEHDALAVLYIERLDVTHRTENLTPAAMVTALDQLAAWVEASVQVWNQYAAGARMMTPVNELTAPHVAEGGAAQHAPRRHPVGSGARPGAHRRVRPARSHLLVDPGLRARLAPAPRLRQPGDQPERRAARTSTTTARCASCWPTPTLAWPNWLDTSGLASGLMSYRYVKATVAPAPTTKLVALGEVRNHLPASTPAFGPADRQAQIASRRQGIARRFRR